MVVLNIDGKDYTLEYTIEASLHKNCVEKVYNFVMNATGGSGKDAISDAISAMSDIPRTALTVFYAGLLENHSDEIKNESDAKRLIKKYFAENKDSEDANFYGLLGMMIDCMSDDGFFKQIGLTQAMTAEENPKKSQSHKKRTAKVTEM